MPREQSYTAIILKKQPFNEADEIITFFTREEGKLRALAKSVKLIKSKLQSSLQSLFEVELRVVGSQHLPKIAGAQVINSLPYLRQSLDLTHLGFYASELVLRFTPDGQKNQQLFDSLQKFLRYLDNSGGALEAALAKFKTEFLSASGLGLDAHVGLAGEQLNLYQSLKDVPFEDLEKNSWQNIQALQKFLSEFIVSNLEREVKSERFLNPL